LLIVPALILGLGGGIILDQQVISRVNPPASIPEDDLAQFRLMGEVWKTIERNYVNQEADRPQQLTYGAIEGMVGTLGDAGHSRFMTPEMAEQHRNFIQGEFEGIGAYVEAKDGKIVIVAPFDNSPAQRAGLRPGDVILKVDGEDVTDHPLTEVVQAIKGPEGTEVSLTVRRSKTEKTRQVTIERAEVELDVVTWAVIPGTSLAHVRIAAFNEGAGAELTETLTEIQSREIDAIVLDLRNNPGGLLNQAVQVASQFLEEGPVLLRKEAKATPEPVDIAETQVTIDLPLVVLINSGTASAAEIVTGALQDAGRARAIGETTFGAGTVLNRFTLSNDAVILLAVEEWRTPKGRVIWHQGLTPDIKVTQPPGARPLLPITEDEMTPESFEAYTDIPLHRAVEILNEDVE
jgi:carboxyl-terminal processing protease